MNLIKNFNLKIFFIFFAVGIFVIVPVNCEESSDKNSELIEVQESADITFNYENENIITIINELAALKNFNVILPQGDIPTIKVTLHLDQKISLSKSWDILNSLLDIAGFFIVPQGSTIKIVKSGKEISREAVPTYIGVSPDDLPNNDQPIRYLYYLANIRISDAPENELNGILKDLLPENTFFKGDTATNGLLLIAKANDIRSAMKIIIELDQVNFQEKIDILPLYHTSASIVSQLINEQLIKPDNANPYRLDTKKAKEVPYFSGFTKVIPEIRLNKLIILGRPQAVERLKDFIKKYIDVAPDSGESILHIYQLQYLNATNLAPVLQRIIQGESGGYGGPSQASAGSSNGGGVERFFDKVIITTDSPINQGMDSANNPDQKQHFTYYGGNNLVVAASNDDWKQIKKLIEELDVPQRTVLIEVLIADLTVEDSRLLGAMTRIPDKVPFPDSMEFQAAMLGQPIPSELPALPTSTLHSDLLKNAYNPDQTLANPSLSGTNNIANFALSGTTMLSLNDNDGNTWSILELLQLFTNSKILSHPHVMARNNSEAVVSVGQTRWLQDQVKDVASNYYGGATTIQFKPIAANLTVQITPRISSANTVNLQVLVTIDEFETGTNTILKRKLETNANVRSGGIFALGGLIRTNTVNTIRETPLLGKIPILGWFFKRKNNVMTKNNLSVFISPTVIEPRLRKGINEYTQDYIDIAKNDTGTLFDSLKDPITRWFFQDKIDTPKVIDQFIEKSSDSHVHERAVIKQEQKIVNDETSVVTNDTGTTTVPTHKEDQLHDLKKILENESNPFLKV